jgi:hypothetical protein
METQKVMDLNELKGVEGISVDLEQFDKKEVEIEKAEIVQVPSEYSDCKTQWVLKVSSVILTSIGEGDDKIDFRASELFNLIQDKEGKLKGYPEAEGSNLAKFMKDLKVFKPSELIGKKPLIKSYQKNDKTYLKFRY